MTNYRVINKRIVSPNGKVISEATSITRSVGSQTEINQSISINISSSSCSSYLSCSSTSSSSLVNTKINNTNIPRE